METNLVVLFELSFSSLSEAVLNRDYNRSTEIHLIFDHKHICQHYKFLLSDAEQADIEKELKAKLVLVQSQPYTRAQVDAEKMKRNNLKQELKGLKEDIVELDKKTWSMQMERAKQLHEVQYQIYLICMVHEY